MIDIHSHVLAGLDDGARTLDEALAMLRLAADSGTTDIVATPHISPDFPNTPDSVRLAFSELSEAARGIIRLHLGCDFHLTYDNLQSFLAAPQQYTINNLRYLMVELSDYVPFGPVTEALARILEEGVVPVITHPERNLSLQQNTRALGDWVSRGMLSQITAQSLLGEFGSRARASAQRFLGEGLVHVVASDGHDLVNRPPCLDRGYAFLTRHYGKPLADRLCIENPGIIIRGEELRSQARPSSFWSRLLQRGS